MILQIDGCDPAFSRMNAWSVAKAVVKQTVVPSLNGGFTDAVVAVDRCGFVRVEGRVDKKKPEILLESFILEWKKYWPGKLRFVKADDEFLSHECKQVCLRHGVQLCQSVPGEHSHNTGRVEGTIRWVKDLGQMFMNLLAVHVKEKVITEEERRSMWFYCLRMATMAMMYSESLLDPKKTRWEEAFHETLNTCYLVLLPFGLKVVGRNLKYDADGRGTECLYLGPSWDVRGGILTYSLKSRAVSCKYSFVPLNNVRRPTNKDLVGMMEVVHGRPVATAPVTRIESAPVVVSKRDSAPKSTATVAESGGELVVRNDVNESQTDVESSVGGEMSSTVSQNDVSESQSESVKPSDRQTELSESQNVSVGAPTMSSDVTIDRIEPNEKDDEWTTALWKKEKKKAAAAKKEATAKVVTTAKNVSSVKQSVVSKYGTRSKSDKLFFVNDDSNSMFKSFAIRDEVEVDFTYVVDTERGIAPKVPSPRERREMPGWLNAQDKEVAKLCAEETFKPLPVVDGKFQLPEDAIILDLLPVCTYKWKHDPTVGRDRWMENVRLVANGKDEPDDGTFYAECPDRTLLLLMLCVGPIIGETCATADAERAYLNAMSVKRNIVIRARGIRGLPLYSLLSKGLYGTRSGAFSWQVWIEAIIKDIDFKKLDVARGVYLRSVESSPMVVRMLRHSDDFLIGCQDSEVRDRAIDVLRGQVRMSEPVSPPKVFLGCTIEYLDDNGVPSKAGRYVCIRQHDKIVAMCEKFKHLHDEYNKHQRVRIVPMPMCALASDDELHAFRELLDSDGVKEFQSLIGSLGWLTRARPDCRFAYLVLSQRGNRPRQWDMYLAVWLMDFLAATIDCPLVLGGTELKTEVFCDASFGTMSERRSVIGHCVTMAPKSGAVCVNVGVTKCAVTSVFEAEILAASAAVDTALYITKAGIEMQYPVESQSYLRCDNEAGVHWMHGSVSNRRSRHVDVHLYHARHVIESGDVIMTHIASEDNIADILTKPMRFSRFNKLARKILGHELLDDLAVPGVMKLVNCSEEKMEMNDEIRLSLDEVFACYNSDISCDA